MMKTVLSEEKGVLPANRWSAWFVTAQCFSAVFFRSVFPQCLYAMILLGHFLPPFV